ncbi:MAG: TrkH family potassium uptake protein [Halosimplex sp.]
MSRTAPARRTLATIARDLGRMLQALSAMMFATLLVAVVWEEFYAIPAILVSGLLPAATGRFLATRYDEADQPGKLHGMMIAASGWFFVALFGSLPFFLLAWNAAIAPDLVHLPASVDTPTLAAFRDPLSAFFESMSGFTGTGLTMTDDESVLPATLQWWRSFIEWVGGVGVIVLTTAILARPGSGSLTLYESEARSEKIHPSIVSTVRTIWWIFTMFTFLSITLLWVAGMPIWGAINHAMTGLATGGYSITDQSIASYHSAAIDFALVPVMILGSIAFPIHFLILRGDVENVYTDLQTRWVFGFFGLGSALLTWVLYAAGVYHAGTTAATVFRSFRYALFQFVSAASCTGFQTAVSLGTAWPTGSQLVVSMGMVVGAAAGSTVGGIKLIRAITLVKGTIFRVQDVFYPDTAVRRFKLDDRRLSDTEAAREFEEAAIISFLWIVFLAVGIAVMLATVNMHRFTLENVIFEVSSAQGNVGLSTGITGPGMPWVSKAALVLNMWVGRLEIIPVVVLFRAVLDRGGFYR